MIHSLAPTDCSCSFTCVGRWRMRPARMYVLAAAGEDGSTAEVEWSGDETARRLWDEVWSPSAGGGRSLQTE